MVQGLGTVIYHVSDLNQAKSWYSKAFVTTPYFDEPFYVGFNIAGYELGLHPNQKTTAAGPGGSVAYWRVTEIQHRTEARPLVLVGFDDPRLDRGAARDYLTDELAVAYDHDAARG